MKIRSFRGERKKARIEIVPMIDTMFFLLVFFMIATLSMTIMRGIPVNLPKSDSARQDIKDDITISLASDGSIYCDKNKMELKDVGALLRSEARANPEILAILSADEEIPHGRVVEVIDEIKLAGITRFAIATRPKK